MDLSNAFVGGLSGVFKGCNVSRNKGIHNVKNLQKLKEITQRNEVTVLNWSDKLETEILIGYSDQLVKVFDLNSSTFTYSEQNIVGEGPIRGIFKLNGSLVTAVQSGVVKIWDETETVLETGGPLSRMRQDPFNENIIATGGKENDLKLWDLETGKSTFSAKNVRHDELELRVPVWVMDLAFLSNSKQVAVATRYGHVRLYDPSSPTRRPVCQILGKDLSFTCIAAAPKENHVVVGCTTGYMYLADLRGKGILLNKYRGFTGSVRQIACPTTQPYIVSVSLDRHLRVHHLNTKRLLLKEYMQSRLSALLLKSSFTIEEEDQEVIGDDDKVTSANTVDEENEEEEDEEYKQMFDEMEVITEKENVKEGSVKRKRKIKTTDKLEDLSNQFEENINDEMVLEMPSSLKKKTKNKSKTKGKIDTQHKLDSNDEDVQVGEMPNISEKLPKTRSRTKVKMSKQNTGEANDEVVEVTEMLNTSENLPKTRSRTKAKTSKQHEEEPNDETVEVVETRSEKRPKNKSTTKVKRFKET